MKSRHVAFFFVAMIGAAALLFSCRSEAASGDLSWTNPTTYTDGTPIAAGAITSSDVAYGLCNAGKTAIAGTPTVVAVPGAATAKSVTGLTNGSWCFQVRTNVGASASDYTAVVAKDVVLKPNPPSGLTVSVQTAFMAVRQNDAYVMLPVGTVPGGTKCDSNNGVLSAGKAYYAVPSAAVTWYGETKPTVVLAACS